MASTRVNLHRSTGGALPVVLAVALHGVAHVLHVTL